MTHDVVIIGGGLAGCEAAATLLGNGIRNMVLIEQHPSIIKDQSWKTFGATVCAFQLETCVARALDGVTFRTSDVDAGTVLSQSSKPIPCFVLDSLRVYEAYQRRLRSILRTSETVISIEPRGRTYRVVTDKRAYSTRLIVDASGYDSVTDRLLFRTSPGPRAYYTCYGRRYSGCRGDLLRGAYFDFDSPFKLAGSWAYPVDAETVEIGVARFSNSRELEDPHAADELERLLGKYKRLPTYNQVFSDSNPANSSLPIKGHIPLLPRLRIRRDGVYYVGDTKGAVPWTGYGVENALQSGRAAAEAIAHGTKYDYFVAPPAKGMAVLAHLWRCGTEQYRKNPLGLAMLENDEAERFFRGNIDLRFLLRVAWITRKLGVDMLEYVPPSLMLAALLNLPPGRRHYDIFRTTG
jgi:flavin-dependent dehydrogenase